MSAKSLYLAGVEKTADAVVHSIESQVVNSLGVTFEMQNVNANVINDIRILMERGYEKEIVMILCQVNDQEQFNENSPQFDHKYIKVDCIDIDGRNVLYNNKLITTDITVKDFKANKFFKEIAESNKNTFASMPLDKLIE